MIEALIAYIQDKGFEVMVFPHPFQSRGYPCFQAWGGIAFLSELLTFHTMCANM
jgi:hypothetical protein